MFSSNDGSEFGGSIYQKVSDNLETAINLNWTTGSNSPRFGIAAKYQLDSTASVSVSSMTSEEAASAESIHKIFTSTILQSHRLVLSSTGGLSLSAVEGFRRGVSVLVCCSGTEFESRAP